MAVQNSLQKTTQATNIIEKSVTYDANGLSVTLSPNIIKNYLVSGNKENVSPDELVMFLNLCKFNQLNPWLKEAYCIKYGSEPATMVVAKEAFQKRAEENPAFDGYEAGIIVYNGAGEIIYRKGALKLPDENVVGGYAEVWRKDKNHSYRIEVSFDEYAGKKRDGTLNAQWSSKPATMIRKVALVQALREAFPKTLGGMYTAEEQGQTEPEDNINVIDYEAPTPIEAPAPAPTQAPTQDVASALFGKS